MLISLGFVLFFASLVVGQCKVSEKSPFNQHLPSCAEGTYSLVKKQTKTKGIVCPMIKDEIGFLSEWVAYYEMHGFNHIMFFDDNSTTSFAEIDTWVKSGFVTIEREWWRNDTALSEKSAQGLLNYDDWLTIQAMSAVACKLKALELGIEIYVSVDVDEYLMPMRKAITVMDDLDRWFNETTRGFAHIHKENFPPTPHLLEPINLLTIEAYQTKWPLPSRMNYYTTTAPKLALRLTGGQEYTKEVSEYLVHCCDIHGCMRMGHALGKRCEELLKAGVVWKLTGKHKKWQETLHIHHYARSFEKYLFKASSGNTSMARGFDGYRFLDRLGGFEFDNAALAWSCQLRRLLRERTGEVDYVRPGDMWYRNPEFGRTVSDPQKRGRGGNGFGKRLAPEVMNPYPEGQTYQRAHKAYTPPIGHVNR